MEKDYLQDALQEFNKDKPNWYGWKTHDDNGDKIPNKDRMQYKYIKIIRPKLVFTSTNYIYFLHYLTIFYNYQFFLKYFSHIKRLYITSLFIFFYFFIKICETKF